jgi:membrane associated rhomboid family serine protease
MNSFNNPYQGRDIKAYYRNFYYQNKLLVYMMAASLVLLMISKAGFFDIFYFVYLIYFGGFIIKQYLGEQKVLTTFLVSGLSGLVLFALLAPQLLVSTLSIQAFIASASIGLLAGAATYVPNMEVMLVFFGRVKIKWIALGLIGIDLLHILNGGGDLLTLSHLGGVTYAALSLYLLRTGSFKFENPFKNVFKRKGPYYKKPKSKQYKTTYSSRPESDEDYLTRKKKEQEEIDKILDKVKKKGYESLSTSEKQKLFNKSNNG